MPETLLKKPLDKSSAEQLELLKRLGLPEFETKLTEFNHARLKPTGIDVLQINLGKMCNQTCHHCHVDAGPHRKEIMSRETMELCLAAIDRSGIKTVDLTGGAPEMNPDFKWFVQALTDLKVYTMVRSNLTIILANPKYHDLPEFFKEHRVEVISSLPHFSKLRTDAQRGDGVFDKSIQALTMLNEVGYGVEGSGLWLNLVYNPTGAMLPPSQTSLERDYKANLQRKYGIHFNNLFSITNMPISRYLDYLVDSGNLEAYLEELITSFNPLTIDSLMCRSMISVGWDGQLYDCDFNQMLEMEANNIRHIKDFDKGSLLARTIKTATHCFGCTAGAGSSCGGEILL